jgi:hypothetical protein
MHRPLPSFLIRRPRANGRYRLSAPAFRQLCALSLSPEHVRRVLTYGRHQYRTPGWQVFAVGKREVGRYCKQDEVPELRDCEGLQATCSLDGFVASLRRDHDFSSLGRPVWGKRRHCPWKRG